MKRHGGALVCALVLLVTTIQWVVFPTFLGYAVNGERWYYTFAAHSSLGGLTNVPIATFSHAGVRHALVNIVALAAVSLVAEPSLSSKRYFSLFWLGSLTAYASEVLVHEVLSQPSVFLLGASGGAWFLLCYTGISLQTVVVVDISIPVWATPFILFAWASIEAFVLHGNAATVGHMSVIVLGSLLALCEPCTVKMLGSS